MIKTIKTTKHMRLDELIKYVFDNDVTNKYFYSEQKKSLYVDFYGKIVPRAHFNKNSLFPVAVEEEITKETVFDTIFAITVEEDRDISYADTFRQTTIPKALRPHTSYLIAMVNDRPELVWERED